MKKKCFIITPIGDEGSETREKAEGVIDSITPVFEALDFELFVPHRMPQPGSITKQILECILNHDLVVANLTELNPNVMYELAVRHSTARPVITIAEFGTKLPFDITTERTIFYTNDMRGVPKLQKELKSSITSINFNNLEFDNPIYRTQRDFKFKETVTEGKDAYMIEQLEEIKKAQQNISGLFKYFNTFERPGLRLIKACKDFNVSLKDIVDYLETKDIIIESNPNYKITPDIYNIIKDRFGFKNKNSHTT
jgi:hypothetical protein